MDHPSDIGLLTRIGFSWSPDPTTDCQYKAPGFYRHRVGVIRPRVLPNSHQFRSLFMTHINHIQRASNFAAFAPFSNLASGNKMGEGDWTGLDSVCRQYMKEISACWFVFTLKRCR